MKDELFLNINANFLLNEGYWFLKKRDNIEIQNKNILQDIIFCLIQNFFGKMVRPDGKYHTTILGHIFCVCCNLRNDKSRKMEYRPILTSRQSCLNYYKIVKKDAKARFDLHYIYKRYKILFLTVVWMMNRCNPSIYAGYSDFGFRNEIW